MTARKPRTVTHCECCGEEIPAGRYSSAIYCSEACSSKGKRRKDPDRYRQINKKSSRRNYARDRQLVYSKRHRERFPEANRESSRRWYRNQPPGSQAERKSRYRESLAVEAIDLLNDIKEKT